MVKLEERKKKRKGGGENSLSPCFEWEKRRGGGKGSPSAFYHLYDRRGGSLLFPSSSFSTCEGKGEINVPFSASKPGGEGNRLLPCIAEGTEGGGGGGGKGPYSINLCNITEGERGEGLLHMSFIISSNLNSKYRNMGVEKKENFFFPSGSLIHREKKKEIDLTLSSILKIRS